MLGAVHLSAILRVYADQGHEILLMLRKNPARAVPVVMKRLEQKAIEWRRCRVQLSRGWEEVYANSMTKALDYSMVKRRAITMDHRMDTGTKSLSTPQAFSITGGDNEADGAAMDDAEAASEEDIGDHGSEDGPSDMEEDDNDEGTEEDGEGDGEGNGEDDDGEDDGEDDGLDAGEDDGLDADGIPLYRRTTEQPPQSRRRGSSNVTACSERGVDVRSMYFAEIRRLLTLLNEARMRLQAAEQTPRGVFVCGSCDTPTTSGMALGGCNHVMCVGCFEKQATTSNQCPYCRSRCSRVLTGVRVDLSRHGNASS